MCNKDLGENWSSSQKIWLPGMRRPCMAAAQSHLWQNPGLDGTGWALNTRHHIAHQMGSKTQTRQVFVEELATSSSPSKL